ncbi:hypothetical protein JCM11641_007020 [Rhodosporidiobolus odoratus]
MPRARPAEIEGRRRSECSSSSSHHTSVVPTPRTSTYADLPTSTYLPSPPLDYFRRKGSAGPSWAPYFPFPLSDVPSSRTASLENVRDASDSPSHSPMPTSPTSPTWPHPDAFSFAPTSKAAVLSEAPSRTPTLSHTQTHHARTHHPSLSASITHALKPRSLLSSKLTRFEVNLVDRLADFLESDDTVESLRRASGCIEAKIVGQRSSGRRRFTSTGSASSINKIRQLVDARLSQTPLRIRLAIRLPPNEPFLLSFLPSRSQPQNDEAAGPIPTYRLAYTAPPPSPSPSSPMPVRPSLSRRTTSGSRSRPSSFHALLPSQGGVNPFRRLSPPGTVTPSSERSGDSFFTAVSSPPRSSPSPSPSSVLLLGLDDSGPPLPQVGSFEARREEYISAVVDELEACVGRRSLVRLKVVVGQQEWKLSMGTEGQGQGTPEGEGWPMTDVEGWKVDASRSQPFGSPQFTYAMSKETIDFFVERLKRKGFTMKKTSNQVHILHLDLSRAVYAIATAQLSVRILPFQSSLLRARLTIHREQGHDLRNLPPQISANGTLSLRKVSTVPSKPFSLSISNPARIDASPSESPDGMPEIRLREGSDLRVKVLADKAATSPSQELSAALQQATWILDAEGVFHVHVKLDPARFAESQTSIRFAAKERWENEAAYRVTVSENRHDNSSSLTWELEVTSQKLNTALAEASFNQLRRRFDREMVTRLVEELVKFCEGLVEPEDVWEKGSSRVEQEGEEGEEAEDGEEAAPVAATAGVLPPLDA